MVYPGGKRRVRSENGGCFVLHKIFCRARSASLLASSGGKALYREAVVWVFRLSVTRTIFSACGYKCPDEPLVESKLTCPIRYLLLPDYFTGKSFEICALQAGVQVFGAERFTVGNKPAEKAARI